MFLSGGSIIEEGPAHEVLTNPRHPVTARFLSVMEADKAPERTCMSSRSSTFYVPQEAHRMKHHLASGFAGDRPLGLFQQEGRAGADAELGRPRHHRDADASRQRRLRAHDRQRSRRRERVPLDPRAQGHRAPRRRSDRRPVHSRLRRRRRRASADRAGRDRECRTRRRAGSAHSRRPAAPEPATPAMPAAASAPTSRRTGAFTITT